MAKTRSLLGKSQAEQSVSTILSESVISLSQAEAIIKESLNWQPSRASLCRWINKGQLEAIRLGRQLFTSQEAVHRFIVARTASMTVAK